MCVCLVDFCEMCVLLSRASADDKYVFRVFEPGALQSGLKYAEDIMSILVSRVVAEADVAVLAATHLGSECWG